MKKLIQLGVLFTLALFLAFATSVVAQKGFVASASLASSGVAFDNENIQNENGFGLQIDLGYNFNPRVGLFLGIGGFALDDNNETLSYLDIGPRFYPLASRGLKPYIDLVLTGSVFEQEVDGVDFVRSGGGIGGGVGIHYFVQRRLGLNLGLTLSRMNYNELRVNDVVVNEDDMRTWNSRIKAGVAYYF
jgi:hypothetical protein